MCSLLCNCFHCRVSGPSPTLPSDKMRIGIPSCLPPKFAHSAQLPRCQALTWHSWRREIVRLSYRPLRVRVREGSSRPSPRRAGQARGATNKSRSLLRQYARRARQGRSRAEHRSSRRPRRNRRHTPTTGCAPAMSRVATPSGRPAWVGPAGRCCPAWSWRPVSPSSHAPFTSFGVSGEVIGKPRTPTRIV
jgi:hypothetical protein